MKVPTAHMVVNKIIRDVWWIVLTYCFKVVSLAIPYEGNKYHCLYLGRVLPIDILLLFFVVEILPPFCGAHLTPFLDLACVCVVVKTILTLGDCCL